MKTVTKRSGGLRINSGNIRGRIDGCHKVKMNPGQSIGVNPITEDYRLLEDGETRSTEDGSLRILE